MIYLRAKDSSVVNRENALDLIDQFLKTNQGKNKSHGSYQLPVSEFLKHFNRLIVEKAGDRSHLVRRKVIQLLSKILDTAREPAERTMILKVLLLKWHDSSLAVKENLVSCLAKLLTSKLRREGA